MKSISSLIICLVLLITASVYAQPPASPGPEKSIAPISGGLDSGKSLPLPDPTAPLPPSFKGDGANKSLLPGLTGANPKPLPAPDPKAPLPPGFKSAAPTKSLPPGAKEPALEKMSPGDTKPAGKSALEGRKRKKDIKAIQVPQNQEMGKQVE